MKRGKRITMGNQNYYVLELDFEVVNEQWDEYKLLDGGVVRMKTTPHRIYRVLDAQGNPAVAEDGEPQLLVQHNTTIVSRGIE